MLLPIALFCVLIAYWLSWGGHASGLQHKDEWVRALLDAGLIAVLGVVTSGVLERFKDTLQERRDASKLRLEALTQLIRTYMDVKLVRRKIQASHEFTSEDIECLNQYQVIFEIHKRISVGLFRQGKTLACCLEAVEKYLNHVANEEDSTERKKFCCKAEFRRGFADPFEKAEALILAEIAGKSPERDCEELPERDCQELAAR